MNVTDLSSNVVKWHPPIALPTPMSSSYFSDLLLNKPSIRIGATLASINITQRRSLPLIPPRTPSQATSDIITGSVPNGNNTDYKRNAYLDAIQYSDCLKEEKDPNKIVKRYLSGSIPLADVAKIIATEESRLQRKGPRRKKDLWMQN